MLSHDSPSRDRSYQKKVCDIIDNLLTIPPYQLKNHDKKPILLDGLSLLTQHHRQYCPQYERILSGLGQHLPSDSFNNIPFLPVNIFKELELKSVPDAALFRTMTSSGTSGKVSKIFLDKDTASYQTKVLNKIVSSYLGSKRLPMLVIDSEKTIKDRRFFSARTAAIKGYGIFAKKLTFALKEDLSINWDTVDEFFSNNTNNPFVIFGFTSLVYAKLLQAIAEKGKRWQLSNGILLHGGGWKKLQDIAVDNETFKQKTQELLGIQRVHNYYGMIEQTGSIFFECNAGYFHCSNYSEILTRRADFSPSKIGEPGLLQTMSLLPLSYPGHNILTEDMGTILGNDDCRCGQKGTYFLVHGRAAKAELRGCSDVPR